MSGDQPTGGRTGGTTTEHAVVAFGRFATSRRAAAVWVGILAVEALLVVSYFALTSATVTRLGYVVAPFVWINASLWAVRRVDPPATTPRRQLLASVVAGAYFLLLLFVTGLLGGGTGGPLGYVELGGGSPGWGPVIRYVGTLFSVTVVPFRVLGYLALAYLVYVAVGRLTASALSGLVGLASCVSCGFSVVLSFVTGITGGSAAAVGAVYAASVEVSTAAFLLALGLLVVGTEATSGNRRRERR